MILIGVELKRQLFLRFKINSADLFRASLKVWDTMLYIFLDQRIFGMIVWKCLRTIGWVSALDLLIKFYILELASSGAAGGHRESSEAFSMWFGVIGINIQSIRVHTKTL